MSDLETALKDYNDTLALANLNLDEVPRNVRAGREAQKRSAEASLEDVRNRYAETLRKALFGIAVTGPGTDDFVKLAKEEADVLVVDGLDLYKRIVSRVSPAMGTNRQFGVSHYSAVIQELRGIAMELNIFSMPAPVWSEPANVGDDAGLLKHVQGMVDSGVGLELPALYLSRQIASAGLAANSSRQTVPVLITGLEADTATKLLAKVFHEGRNALVATTNEVTKEFVLDTFNKVKKQIKTNKKS